MIHVQAGGTGHVSLRFASPHLLLKRGSGLPMISSNPKFKPQNKSVQDVAEMKMNTIELLAALVFSTGGLHERRSAYIVRPTV